MGRARGSWEVFSRFSTPKGKIWNKRGNNWEVFIPRYLTQLFFGFVLFLPLRGKKRTKLRILYPFGEKIQRKKKNYRGKVTKGGSKPTNYLGGKKAQKSNLGERNLRFLSPRFDAFSPIIFFYGRNRKRDIRSRERRMGPIRELFSFAKKNRTLTDYY